MIIHYLFLNVNHNLANKIVFQVQSKGEREHPAGPMTRHLFLLVLCVLATSAASAQLSLQGASPSMIITTGVAGGQPVAVIDAATRMNDRGRFARHEMG